MHYMILVAGDDPLGQLTGQPGNKRWERGESTLRVTGTADGSYHYGDDWYGIGGRYTGLLATKPGATSGRVYGDAIPPAEAHLHALGAEAGLRVARGTADHSGPGLDQALMADLAALPAGEQARHAAELAAGRAATDDWYRQVDELLGSLPGETLITVIDAHE